MTSDWIYAYILDCVSRNVCTRIHCTTCRAHEFRNGLAKGLGLNPIPGRFAGFERREVRAICSALGGVPTPDANRVAWEEAARFIIMDLWTGMPFLDQEVEVQLAGSWAGEVLQRMNEHHQKRRFEAELASPERASERRAENRRQKQIAHMMRLSAKVERDAAWRAQLRENSS